MPETTGPHIHDTALRARIHGRVQGVGFRWFVWACAQRLLLSGFVRNRADGTVETQAAGAPAALEEFLNALRQGPPGAHVTAVDVQWLDGASSPPTEFEIRP